MNLFVDSKVSDEAYLIPCSKVVIFDDVLLVYDLGNDYFDFKLCDYEFMVLNHDPVE